MGETSKPSSKVRQWARSRASPDLACGAEQDAPSWHYFWSTQSSLGVDVDAHRGRQGHDRTVFDLLRYSQRLRPYSVFVYASPRSFEQPVPPMAPFTLRALTSLGCSLRT